MPLVGRSPRFSGMIYWGWNIARLMAERPSLSAQTVLDLLGGYAFARLRRYFAAASCLSSSPAITASLIVSSVGINLSVSPTSMVGFFGAISMRLFP